MSYSVEDILSQIVSTSVLDAAPLLGSSEFISGETLVEKTKNYLIFSRGRVSVGELQAYLNVEMIHVDKVIKQVGKKSDYICNSDVIFDRCLSRTLLYN